MDCNSCHKPLPQGSKVCPNCGVPTPAYYGSSGASSDDLTSPSVSSDLSSNKVSETSSNARTAPSVSSGMLSNGASDPYSNASPSAPSAPSGPSYHTPSTLHTNPYSNTLSNPYTVSPPPPPPPPSPTQYSVPLETSTPLVQHTQYPQRPKNRTALSMGASLLALVLIGAGVFFFLSNAGSHSSTTNAGTTPASYTTSTQPVDTVKLDATTAQKLYDSTTSGAPAMDEALGAPDSYGWDHVTQPNTSCTFAGGAYHAQAKPGYFAPCYASATNFSNLLLQVQMTVVSGHAGGIVFRANATNDYAYQFRISTDGTYILNKYVVDGGQAATKPLLSGTSPAIVKGMNQHNLIAILAQGSAIALYINKKYVDTTNDTTYQQGQIGVYTDSDPSSVVDAAFSKLQVWKL